MLSLVNVSKTYKMKNALSVKALDHVSVDFQEKGMIFILGKSGSGKSTMLNIIGGLDRADEGEVIIKGKSSLNFKGHDYDSYRNTFIGFVFQEYNLLEDFTIGKNIALALELQGKKATKEAIADILAKVDMTGFENRRVNQISGGQKQRVAIARALIKSPEIILADEPTGALDSVTGRQVFEILQKLSNEKLVIVVSHDRETAELYGDRIIEMKDGQILSDTSKEITHAKEVRKGLSINNNVVHLEEGYKLDNPDLVLLRDLQASNENVIITKNRQMVDSFTFDQTKKERITLKDYDGNILKFISSKLKNLDSLKIGASGLKHKRVRLFFTIILSFISITFFALTDTMSAFKSGESHARTLADHDIRSVQLRQTYMIDDGYFSYGTSVNFTDEALNDMKAAFPTAGIAPIVDNDIYFNFDSSTISSLNAGNRVLNSQLYNFQKMSMFVDEQYFDNLDMEFLAGDFPSNGSDIVITSFALELFYRFSLPYYVADGFDSYMLEYIKPADFLPTEVGRATQVLDKSLFISDLDVKIAGVVAVDYDEEMFDPENLEELAQDYYGQQDLYNYVNNNYLFTFYRNDVALDNLHNSDEYFADEYYPVNANTMTNYGDDEWYPNRNINFIIEESQLFTDRLISFSNESLADDEIILSYNILMESDATAANMYIAEYDEFNNPVLTIRVSDNELYNFSSINQLLSWADNTTNKQKLVSLFSSEVGDYKINNGNRGYQDYSEYTLAGIYFPTSAINGSGASKTLLFQTYILSTITFGQGRLEDFPLSLISRLAFINNDDNLYNSYSRLMIYKNGDYSLSVESAYSMVFDMFGSLVEGLTLTFLILGSILAGFSALLMMNFIATSISYKKRDIGILRGLGARKLDVVKIFTYESLIIALINIVLAIVVTIPAVGLINGQIAQSIQADIVLIAFTLRQVVLVIGIATISALVASILPVLGIARKKPIDAINNR